MLAYLGGGTAQAPRPFAAPQLAPHRNMRSPPPRPTDERPGAGGRRSGPLRVRPRSPSSRRRSRSRRLMRPCADGTRRQLSRFAAADPKALLLQVASDRTGYPPDMLGLDLNMEADLGIDSIKRVEILGAFRKMLPARSARRCRSGWTTWLRRKVCRTSWIWWPRAAGGPVPRPFDLAGKWRDAPSTALSRHPFRRRTSPRHRLRATPSGPLPSHCRPATPRRCRRSSTSSFRINWASRRS